MYSVVEILGTLEVDLVPNIWITGNNCAWTSHLKTTAITQAVRNKVPADASLQWWEVRVLYSTGGSETCYAVLTFIYQL